MILPDNSIIQLTNPIDEQGWRFYLNSYDQNGIVITARNDPGNKIVVTGILAVMIALSACLLPVYAAVIWGRYWSWDQKETWSLITWFLYLIYFHCRKNGKLRKYENMAHAFAFAALVSTFILVNILPKLASKMHSYV